MITGGKRTKSFMITGILLALTLFTLTGCKGVKRNGSKDQEEFDYLITVGLVQSGESSSWKTANTESFKAIFIEDNGYELLYEDAMLDQEKQYRAVRKFIEEGVDYIILSPVVETGWHEILEEAKEAGISVILINRLIDEVDTSLYECWIGADFYQQALHIGEWLEENLEPKNEAKEETNTVKEEDKEDKQEEGEEDSEEDITNEVIFAAIQGTIGSYEQMERAAGYEEFLEKHDDWNMLGRQTGENQKKAGKEVMNLFLEQIPPPDVVIAENEEMALGAAEALAQTEKEDKEIILICCGASQEILKAVEEGVIAAAFEQNPLIARKTAEIIQKLEASITVEKKQFVAGEYFDASMDLEKISEERKY